MNARSTDNDFLVDREYRGNPAWLTYFKITLHAERNKITDMVHPASISFSYWYQSEATPIADALPQSSPSKSIVILNHQSYSVFWNFIPSQCKENLQKLIMTFVSGERVSGLLRPLTCVPSSQSFSELNLLETLCQ